MGQGSDLPLSRGFWAKSQNRKAISQWLSDGACRHMTKQIRERSFHVDSGTGHHSDCDSTFFTVSQESLFLFSSFSLTAYRYSVSFDWIDSHSVMPLNPLTLSITQSPVLRAPLILLLTLLKLMQDLNLRIGRCWHNGFPVTLRTIQIRRHTWRRYPSAVVVVIQLHCWIVVGRRQMLLMRMMSGHRESRVVIDVT
jgi:hypothetical protein